MHSDYGVFVDEVVEEGVDGEAGDALDACLAHDVLAVGGDGEDAHVEACGNLLVREALCDLYEHCRLATCELVAACGCLSCRRLGAEVSQRLNYRLAAVANVDHCIEMP